MFYFRNIFNSTDIMSYGSNRNITNASLVDCKTDLQKAELPVLLVLSILLDGLSVFVLTQIRSRNNHIHHFLITTLAANDLVTMLLFTVMWIANVTVCGKFGGDTMCSVLGWFGTSMVIWSAWVVVVMSGVRFLSVVKPFYYKMKVKISTISYGLVATILLTFGHLVLPFTGVVQPYRMYTENYICAYDFAPGAGGKLHRVMLGLMAGVGLMTMAAVLYLNGRIICALRRVGPTPANGVVTVSTTREKRSSFANLQTKVVAGVYCFCYGPFLIRLMYDVIQNSAAQDDRYHSITMSLLFMSPLINPFVYAACIKSFRQYIVEKAKYVVGKCGLRSEHTNPVVSLTGTSGSRLPGTGFSEQTPC